WNPTRRPTVTFPDSAPQGARQIGVSPVLALPLRPPLPGSMRTDGMRRRTARPGMRGMRGPGTRAGTRRAPTECVGA
ncbi:MAG TPA: hypothetical protein VL738_30890, partial [Dactylosporangium sp.]|nr:hypothetical protein [Dactylosporangium sp.]